MKQTVKEYKEGIFDYMHKAINAYKHVENPEDWDNCPNCGLIPKEWIFDNGRHTACGCGKNEYEHFSVDAESIMSVFKRSDNGTNATEYKIDELRKNWNHFAKTGEMLFISSKRTDGRW